MKPRSKLRGASTYDQGKASRVALKVKVSPGAGQAALSQRANMRCLGGVTAVSPYSISPTLHRSR